MGINVNTSSWGNDESLDFIAFAFGDFNTSAYNDGTKSFVRTSDGDRYNQHLSPQLNDKTADVPGGDGMYFFGTTHKAKTFDVSFAFQGLTKADIRALKKAFDGKEIKELCFAEESDRIYMAKVTSQPSIKMLAFGDGNNETYNGEGTIQFTAYWPYAKSPEKNRAVIFSKDKANTDEADKTSELKPDSNDSTKSNDLINQGDIATWFEFSSTTEAKVSKIELYGPSQDNLNTSALLCTIEGENITYWSSKTGIIKSGENVIPYTGDGFFRIPISGTVTCTAKIYHKNIGSTFAFKYHYWYY